MFTRVKWKFEMELQEWIQIICITIKEQVQNTLESPQAFYAFELNKADLIRTKCVHRALKKIGYQGMGNLGSNPSCTTS